MKSFRTELFIHPSADRIQLSTPILTMGSCFSDAIGGLLGRYKFKVAANPLGVIYNPVSIHKVLLQSVHNELPQPETYLENQGLWYNYDFHSSISASTKTLVQKKIADSIGSVHYFLKGARFLIMTYGTAWVFERRGTGERVANCHKMPGSNFIKKLLSVDEICASFDDGYAALKSFQPEIKVILTVSPVRHVKDTLELNSVSKAVLRLATYRISETYPEVQYFPAFEMMMDDLRDYRFYASDMLHPSDEAMAYIWEKFSEQYFDPDVRNFIREWDSLSASLRHVPFHPETESHKKFLNDLLARLEKLKSIVDTDDEIRLIRSQLHQTKSARG